MIQQDVAVGCVAPISVRYGSVTVRYQPVSAADRVSLISGSCNERVFMPRVLESLNSGAARVVFDIGAHTGLWTIPFAAHLRSSGRVYAFDPVQACVEAIERNARINNLCNIVTHRAAIAATERETDLFVRPDSEMHSLFDSDALLRRPADQYIERITTTTIDSIVRSGTTPAPDVIKIDVEGAEMLVLEGISHEVTGVQLILVEVHPLILKRRGMIRPREEIVQKLRGIGLRHITYLDELHILASRSCEWEYT